MSSRAVPSSFNFEQCMLIQLGISPKKFAVDSPNYPDINIAALRGEAPVGQFQTTDLTVLPAVSTVTPVVSIVVSNESDNELMSESEDEDNDDDDF